ncbi:hypothetical protein [Pseudomonas sp. 31 R 17]|uniref:DUF6602 domain-containing protein n=1 Tax=Pseudomonas sp. 31 R 17 TaxID=1844101 RepID=UPI000811F67C|nr:DUF6602 domain-containing protein [Pseudomonas sp. 31 R 17]CRM70695.1 hypothetical protein [Pseudomonas sp. 31 R 17]
MFEEIFRARVAELRAMFSATRGVLHKGEKGALRESFVINLLQQFLPFHFGVGSGVVVDKNGSESVQVDIVIYDKRTMPPILETAGRGVYLIDSVLRVIEVKSVVDGRALDQFSRMIECFDPENPQGLKMAGKGKLEGGQSYYPVCALFGFESKVSSLGDFCYRNPIIKNSSGLVYLDSGGLWTHKMFDTTNIELDYDGRYIEFDDDIYGLRMFVGLLFDQLEESARSRSDYKPLDWLL